MFFCNLKHTAKEAIKTRSGKVKKARRQKAGFTTLLERCTSKNIKKIHPSELSL
jgi:hypothetical protein